ncbi:DUF6746 family protein [Halomonas sp. HK25]|uniref:DUF6746 family protein n=1 Tax=Halomonas sp. HK25 TaxID=3394321 RepID=UPI0039FCCFC3
MKRPITRVLLVALFAGLMAGGVYAEENAKEHAEERPDHFEGQSADSLSQAVSNLSSTNDHLAALLAKDELSDDDMAIIHQLTYTLENALAKLGEEVDTMADLVEEVHLGSESMERDRVRENGQTYLETIRPLVR